MFRSHFFSMENPRFIVQFAALISKRLDALNAMQKILTLTKDQFMKNQEKSSKITIFPPQNCKNGIFWRFFFILSETVLCKELGIFALRSVHQDASFELSESTFFFVIFSVSFFFKGEGWF